MAWQHSRAPSASVCWPGRYSGGVATRRPNRTQRRRRPHRGALLERSGSRAPVAPPGPALCCVHLWPSQYRKTPGLVPYQPGPAAMTPATTRTTTRRRLPGRPWQSGSCHPRRPEWLFGPDSATATSSSSPQGAGRPRTAAMYRGGLVYVLVPPIASMSGRGPRGPALLPCVVRGGRKASAELQRIGWFSAS
jgi:hypothetical protein